MASASASSSISIKRERLDSGDVDADSPLPEPKPTCANCHTVCEQEDQDGEGSGAGTTNLNLFTSILRTSTSLASAAATTSGAYDEELPTIQEALSLLYGVKFRMTEDSMLEGPDEDGTGIRTTLLGLCPRCTEGLRAHYEAHVRFSIELCSPDSILYPKFEKAAQRIQTQDLGRENGDDDEEGGAGAGENENDFLRSKRLAAKLQRKFILDKEVRVIIPRVDYLDGQQPRASTSRGSASSNAQVNLHKARDVLSKIRENSAYRTNLEKDGTRRANDLTTIENMFPPQVRAQFKSTLRKIITTLKENQNNPPHDLFTIPGKPFGGGSGTFM